MSFCNGTKALTLGLGVRPVPFFPKKHPRATTNIAGQIQEYLAAVTG